MNLELLLDNIRNAETPADELVILREAIEKLIQWSKPDNLLVYPTSDAEWFKEVKGYNTATSDYESNLLASIQPKEMK